MKKISILVLCLCASIFYSCKSGSTNLFKPSSPHEIYKRKLIAAGLDKSNLGLSWINSSATSKEKALDISIPYKETGYFPSDKTPAHSYKFTVIKGQKIYVSLNKKPVNTSPIYLDIWEIKETNVLNLIASADTLGSVLELDIKETGNYLLRIQPELLQSWEYTLHITSGPSLGFPTKTGRNNIKSFWGDGRDNNVRKHEGVDIFGALRSPVLATSDGRVTRVNENNLGGKVIWFRPKGKDYTLYYAHLDQQIAIEGQEVLAGETLGLMGNTGNAKYTATHLHFGIYTSSGAIDPFPFINPELKEPARVSAPTSSLNKILRTKSNLSLKVTTTDQKLVKVLPKGTIVRVIAASGNSYRIILPNGDTGFLNSNDVVQVSTPITTFKVSANQLQVYDEPDSLAAVKLSLPLSKRVNVVGSFEDFYLVSLDAEQFGWIKKASPLL